MEDHWNDVYSSKPQETLGWYQEDPQPDLAMILSLQMPKSSRIVIAGCGTTTIIEHLIQEGYTNLVLVDLSEVALQILAKRFSNYNFEYIAADLGSNEVYHKIYGMAIELWYDRATLHFLTGDEQIANYRKNIGLLEPNYVMLAQFSTEGATRCSGLDIRQYDRTSLRKILNHNYTEVESREHIYVNPSGGDRPYIYGVYNRVFEE